MVAGLGEADAAAGSTRNVVELEPSCEFAFCCRGSYLLAANGTLVVMDSPMFGADRDGSQMVSDSLRRFTALCGITGAVQQGIGYLTFATLAAIAERLNLRPQFVPSRGPLTWRLRRNFARLRLRRAPAAFGLWVAR